MSTNVYAKFRKVWTIYKQYLPGDTDWFCEFIDNCTKQTKQLRSTYVFSFRALIKNWIFHRQWQLNVHYFILKGALFI